MKKRASKKERKQLVTMMFLSSGAIFFIIIVAILVAMGLLLLMQTLGIIFPKDMDYELWQILLFLAAISAIIGFGLSMLLSKIPLKPIHRFIRQMKRLSAGDFSTRLDLGGLEKLSMLSDITEGFNKMAEELGNTEMLRRDFINNFSHEFKTPIVSIAGFAKLLKRGNLTEEQRQEYLDIIEEESLRLSSMATNVLNMTKVENQNILSDVNEFNLSEQIRNCILLLEMKWARKDIEFCIDFDEHRINAGEELLKQVWVNLIDNAVKFSPNGGTITINIEEDQTYIRVTVTNIGEEIPPEQQKRIFDKFYQGDESHSSEGSGIGLALVKRIVALHGGRVGVNCADGKVTFSVSLPKERHTLYLR